MKKKTIILDDESVSIDVIGKLYQKKESKEILNIDADLSNADWTKQSWDLPKYKSKEFMDWLKFSGMTLAQFKTLPVYKLAVQSGKIKEID